VLGRASAPVLHRFHSHSRIFPPGPCILNCGDVEKISSRMPSMLPGSLRARLLPTSFHTSPRNRMCYDLVSPKTSSPLGSKMIDESKNHTGVVCLLCERPFPVSAKVIYLKREIEQDAADVIHAFAARCDWCKCESVYVISDVQIFSEEPRKRARAAGR
jgi:hypothetical protein